jgi:NadR type nicotinamide-nucleotide adenylyltransferase
MKHGIIFMTALVPTIGHERLINFAKTFMDMVDGKLHVIVSSRSFEPSITSDRSDIMANNWKDVYFYDHRDDNAPQQCINDDDWNYWVNVSKVATNGYNIDYIFGSENYCIEFSKHLNCEYIPVDPYREVISVRGTNVRSDILMNQDKILSSWIKEKKKHFVFFGQESVGKTTMTNIMSSYANTRKFHEWARPYLEQIGPEVTIEKMYNIVRGQYFIDKEVRELNNLFTFQDTDLLSTYGYFKFWKPELDVSWLKDIILKMDNSKTTYLLCSPNGVIFEKDQLRYGVDKRETEMSYWENLLKEFNFNYYILEGTEYDRFDTILKKEFKELDEIKEFVRD